VHPEKGDPGASSHDDPPSWRPALAAFAERLALQALELGLEPLTQIASPALQRGARGVVTGEPAVDEYSCAACSAVEVDGAGPSPLPIRIMALPISSSYVNRRWFAN
jgi:hypothetical protein